MDTAPASRVIDIAIGHGLGETRWKGFLIFIISEFL
jgi:hypothetical protein